MKAKLTPLLVALAVGAFAAAGCGGDDDNESSDTGATAPAETATTESAPPEETESSGGGGGERLEIAADPGGALKFDKDQLTAKAGEVKIVMENPSSLPHAVEIEADGPETKGETVNQGETSTAEATLEAGEYKFYCPVPGHEQGGMVGTLTVE